MPIKIIHGDLLTTDAKYICHQVNCRGVMGSGVAKQIRAKYPEVYEAYVQKCNDPDSRLSYFDGVHSCLGTAQFVPCHDGHVVVNLFAQYGYGRDGATYTNYTAFRVCVAELTIGVPPGETIAMPYKIGCGLGGGDWETILDIIDEVLYDKFTVELWKL